MRILKKEITFIYMDGAEKAMYESVAEEARKRGYKVKLTTDKFAKCEIGIYCQHVNFPQYSKFSFIMLHDIIQQYANWPDLWLREPWDKYNVGLLPSNQWIDNWNECSQYYYANPKNGMFRVGWPKADKYNNIDREEYKRKFNEKYKLNNSWKTILYAPSWENDNKQDDFVQAMLGLDVNILIKQYPADSETFPEMAKEISKMYSLHKDNPRVTILDPKTNIIEAIVACDVLVSEESSTMCEAVMMGIPAVSVSNWLIPDVIPKRYPSCKYDFVIKTRKEELSDCIRQIINDYESFKADVEVNRKKFFGDSTNTSSIIMDIVDDCINGKVIRYPKLKSNKRKMVPFRKLMFHIKERIRRQFAYNLKIRYKSIAWIWNGAKKIRDVFRGQNQKM